MTHDPREQARGIHQILISDKKRIGFLFGAGCSFATGVASASVPVVARMTELVTDVVEAHSDTFKRALASIKGELNEKRIGFNIETLLTAIESKRQAIGAGTLNELDASSFEELANIVKREVITLASVHDGLLPEDRRNLSHSKLAKWAQKARRRFPSEFFTTNYDYLFEIAFEGLGIPYFDGFAGSFEPFFCAESVEDIGAYSHLLKLWKMHGSLGWYFRESDNCVVRPRQPTADDILIYPSNLKYNASKKQPYVGLIDRLCTFLQQDDAVLFVCGYSFGDEHINERLVTSLRRGSNSAVIALYYDEVGQGAESSVYGLMDEQNVVRTLATSETAGRMSALGRRHAVIGGKFGQWKLRDEPDFGESIQVNQYFDEDAALPTEAVGERTGDEVWSGTGTLLLPDFGRLADFLDDLTIP